MAPRKRNLKKRASTLDSNTLAWLRGDRENCSVFFRAKPTDELAALWAEYGDPQTMRWQPGMRLPEPFDG